MLWIAFKLVFLRENSQVNITYLFICNCCELLSNWYFYVRTHRNNFKQNKAVIVVNCFQIGIFTWELTGKSVVYWLYSSLWIAFKLVFLRENSQAGEIEWIAFTSCELLSNWYFYVRTHRNLLYLVLVGEVVNCFQIGIFTWELTGINARSCNWTRLWIAFKLVFLRENSQGCNHYWQSKTCCELLSNWYFYVRTHRQIIFL